MLANHTAVLHSAHMIERCPARELELDVSVETISEVNIPEACLRCIQRAQRDPRAVVQVTDTFDAGLAYTRERTGAEANEDELNKWRFIGLTPPAEGLGRQALIETGFDIGLNYFYDTESYVDGTETETTHLEFNCYNETVE